MRASRDLHIALVEQVQERIPPGAKVVLLGDGEFDSTALQQTMEDAEWSYVCRTGCNLTATWDGDTFRLDTLGCCIKPGMLVDLPMVFFTAKGYGPIRLICCWGPVPAYLPGKRLPEPNGDATAALNTHAAVPVWQLRRLTPAVVEPREEPDWPVAAAGKGRFFDRQSLQLPPRTSRGTLVGGSVEAHAWEASFG